MAVFHDQSPQKYGTGPGSNMQPLDLQSDTFLQSDRLPTALRGPAPHCFFRPLFCLFLSGCLRQVSLYTFWTANNRLSLCSVCTDNFAVCYVLRHQKLEHFSYIGR